MRFRIEGKLPSLNKYISIERTNRFMAAKMKKEATTMVAWSVKYLKKIEHPATYTFTWHVSNKRSDPDNIAFACKYIFDGLQEAGRLVNDNMKYVLAIDHRFVIGKEDFVEVEVIEYPEDTIQ